MTPEQLAYINGRRRQIRYWPWMAVVLVALIAAFFGWLWVNAPINIDPTRVLAEFKTRTLSDEELILLAARGTLALITCGLLLLLLVLLITLSVWGERRLIRLLDEATGAPASSPSVAAEPGVAGESGLVTEPSVMAAATAPDGADTLADAPGASPVDAGAADRGD